MRVYKYTLSLGDYISIEMPKGACVLSVQAQRGEVMTIWALVDPSARTEPRRFRLAGTGHDLDPAPGTELRFIDTAQVFGGDIVLHLFEIVAVV